MLLLLLLPSQSLFLRAFRFFLYPLRRPITNTSTPQVCVCTPPLRFDRWHTPARASARPRGELAGRGARVLGWSASGTGESTSLRLSDSFGAQTPITRHGVFCLSFALLLLAFGFFVGQIEISTTGTKKGFLKLFFPRALARCDGKDS